MRPPAKLIRLKIWAMSSWSRDSRSRDSVTTAFQRIPQQVLDAGADQARARYAAIAVLLINGPAFLGGAFAANPVLVLDRSFPLQIGRIAGVDGSGAHPESFVPPADRGAGRVLLRRAA